mgnify:FL=1
MTYTQFKKIMIEIKSGSDNICIGKLGFHSNDDAKIRMGLLLDLVPEEYCTRLLKEETTE